ncbi:MAG: right-handed parallel beta-helix repeat-containing protein [Phycisphaerales bacterium]|jgi:hypothetical protein
MSKKRKRMKKAFILAFMIWIPATVIAEAPKSPYLGQTPPGLKPEIFAPGVICRENRYEQYITFTPDGNEVYFGVTNAAWNVCHVWHARQVQGRWTTPARTRFVGNEDAWCLRMALQGERFYFMSARPSYPPSNIWMCERSTNGWSAPQKLGPPINTHHDEWGFMVLPDQSMYFSSMRPGGKGVGDIWYSPYVDGRYGPPQNVEVLNWSNGDDDPFLPNDQSFLIMNSFGRSDGYGQGDIYISFPDEQTQWTVPRNLGPVINTSGDEFSFSLSPDEKFGFFTRRTGSDSNIYWIDARAILPDPNGPIKNINSEQRFSSIQCAINYADDGDTIVMNPGIYNESIDITDKKVLLQSVDPNDSFYIGGTIIQGSADSPVVTLRYNSEACEIAGLTIRSGLTGITGTATDVTIRNCRIMDNITHGLELARRSEPHLLNCLITGNGQTGITNLANPGRSSSLCAPLIENCVIVQNGSENIVGGEPVIIDSVVSQ